MRRAKRGQVGNNREEVQAFFVGGLKSPKEENESRRKGSLIVLWESGDKKEGGGWSFQFPVMELDRRTRLAALRRPGLARMGRLGSARLKSARGKRGQHRRVAGSEDS